MNFFKERHIPAVSIFELLNVFSSTEDQKTKLFIHGMAHSNQNSRDTENITTYL